MSPAVCGRCADRLNRTTLGARSAALLCLLSVCLPSLRTPSARLSLETQNAVTGVLCDAESLRVNTSTFLRNHRPALSIANNTRGATARVAGRVGNDNASQFLHRRRCARSAPRCRRSRRLRGRATGQHRIRATARSARPPQPNARPQLTI